MEQYFSDVTESSKNLYLANMRRLNDGVTPKNIAFLKKLDSVDEKLMKMCENTRRTYLIPILKIFKDYKVKKYYNHYSKMLDELKKNTSHEKTEKDKTNWIQNLDIETKKGSLEELIHGLYTKLPPRRSLDYVNVKLCEPVDEKENYYHNKKFYFGNYKTAGTYGRQIVEVPEDLDDIIQEYIKNNSKEFLIPNWSSLKNNRILNKIFGASVNMLRKKHATDLHAKPMKALEQTAVDLGNSPATLVAHYIKH